MSENRQRFQNLRKEVVKSKAKWNRAKKAIKAANKHGSEKQKARCQENLERAQMKCEDALEELALFKSQTRVTLLDKLNLKNAGVILITGACILAGLYLYVTTGEDESGSEAAADDLSA